MTDDVWRELLQSPLDDDPPDGRSGEDGGKNPGLRFLAIGLAIGVMVAAGWVLLAGDDAVPETEAAVATTTSEAPGVVVDAFPVGYVEVADGVGARPEVMYVQGSDLYLVVSTAVRSDVDPATVETFKGGEWVVLGGVAPVTASAEFSSAQTLGVVTVRFSAGAIPPGQATSLRLSPATPRVSYDHEVEYTTEGLPFETSEALRFSADYGDAEVVVDRIAFDANVGVVEWHVDGPDTVRARVDTVVVLPDTAGGEDDPATRLVSGRLTQTFGFDRPGQPAVGHSRGEDDVIRRVGNEVETDDEISSVVVLLTISVQDVVRGEPIELPLDGVEVLER